MGDTPKTSRDSLDSRARASFLDLISEGEIEGLVTPVPNFDENEIDGAANPWHQSIFLNNTPLQNRDGSYNYFDLKIDQRTGLANQSVIPGFNETVRETSVNVELKQLAAGQDVPGTLAQWEGNGHVITITNRAVDAVRIVISIPALQKTEDDGDTKGKSVAYRFQKKQGTGEFVDIDLGTKKLNIYGAKDGDAFVSGRTADLYQKQYRFEITGNTFPVQFRIVRIARDEDRWNLSAKDWLNVNAKTVVHSYAEITYAGEYERIACTYVQNNGAETPAAGNIITISTRTDYPHNAGEYQKHKLKVGDIVSLDFTPQDGKTIGTNDNLAVATVVNDSTFTVIASDSKLLSPPTAEELASNETPSPARYRNVRVSPVYTYPNTALVGLQVEAEEFGSVPKRAYKIRGKKIKIPGAGANGSGTPTVVTDKVVADNLGISNADEIQTWGFIYYPSGYIFNGTLTTTTHWCADPAWCLYDLLLSSRYGTGDHVDAAQLDKYSFYAASRYSSEIVEFHDRFNDGTIQKIREPRFSLNAVLRKKEDAYRIIAQLCSVFRVMPYYGAGALNLSQDKKGVDPSYLFTLANVSPEGFSYSGVAQTTRITVAIVKYYDMTLRDMAYEEVIDDAAVQKFGVVSKTINAFGCTSRGAARRVGRWLIYVAQNETETCTFVTSLEAGTVCRPGQIIEIADPVKAGVRRGGRIKAVPAANQITVDNTDLTDLPGIGNESISYTRTLHVIMQNGSICTADVGTDGISASGVITTVTNFRIKVNDSAGREPNQPDYVDTFQDQTPNVNSLWILETTGGTSAQNLQTSTWKVVGVKEEEDFQYTVTCVSHDESKYDHVEQDQGLNHRDLTNLDEIPAAPSGWAVRPTGYAGDDESGNAIASSSITFPHQQLYRHRDEVRVKVIAAWKPVLGVNKYEVRWRESEGGWNTIRVQNPDYEITNVSIDKSIGTKVFDFEIYSVSAYGKKSVTPLKTSFTCTGKTAKPSNVVTFTGTTDKNLGDRLTWVKIAPTAPEFADLDIRGYEIRRGTGWDSATVIGEFVGTTATVGTLVSGASITYLIKAIDTDDNYSVTAKSVAITPVFPGAPTEGSFDYKDDNLILNWSTPATGSYAIEEYEIYKGDISASNLEGIVTGKTFSIPVTWNTPQTFKVRAKDIAGNIGGSALEITVTFTQAPAPNITWQYEGRTLRLTWNQVSGSTTAREYEIRSSATNVTAVGNASVITRVQATTYVVDVDWVASRRFWVRAIDINDNFGVTGRTGIENAPDYPDVTFSFPESPVVTSDDLDGKNENIVLNWTALTAATNNSGKTHGLPIREYKIYRTDSAAESASNLIATSYTTVFSEKITWTEGTKKYWVSAVDVNDNEGDATAYIQSVTQVPVPVDITQEVIDNNILLRWKEPSLTGCLPITAYNIYKTNTQAGSLIGSKQGKFTTIFEQVAGTYTYYLAAVDSAGRQGVAGSVTSIVNEPPDYVLNADLKTALIDDASRGANDYVSATYSQSNSDNSGAGLIVTVTKQSHGLSVNQQIEINFTSGTANGTTDDAKKYIIKTTTINEFTFEVAGSRQTTGNIDYKSPATTSNFYVLNNVGYFCLDTSIQYQNHFASDAFNSNGANVPYALPSANSGSYEEVFDYGSVLANSAISIAMSIDPEETVGQGLTITPRIYVSSDNSNWTDKGSGNGSVFATQFRYVKARFDLAGADANDLIKVTEISLKLSVKQKTDQGSVTVASGQAQAVYDAGVQVSFTKTFLDIDSIALTIRGSTGDARYAIYDFLDEASPTGFRVYLYKADGTKTYGVFDWTARGV
tara:strand:+ start:3119 stop:8521 length:5403 start_codon:yes stop_codon:yes gene_type:complete